MHLATMMATESAPVLNKTWELSLYELHRTPEEAITDNTEIAVSPRSLHSELMCPICLDMLKNTMTTKECLHRFCQECIITALRSGNKECPTCRKKLVSKRSLRPDPNFDALISKIYPNRDEYEAHQERVLAKLNKHHNANALTNSIEEGLRLQALNRAQRVRKHVTENGDPGESSTSCDNTPLKRQRTESEENGSVDIPGEPDAESIDGDEHSVGDDDGEASTSGDSTLGLNDTHEDCDSRERDAALDQRVANDIELVFKPHPKEEQHHDDGSQTRYIKTTANATGACRLSLLLMIPCPVNGSLFNM